MVSSYNSTSPTESLLEVVEKRTQRTYRYGIGLVCVGATLNWLGFAQGNSTPEPVRYLGVACVISGSFCVCLAMCRWLGRPIISHPLAEETESLHEVHVINVAVPQHLFRSGGGVKPPDYEVAVRREPPPPPYQEAITLSPVSYLAPPPTLLLPTSQPTTRPQPPLFIEWCSTGRRKEEEPSNSGTYGGGVAERVYYCNCLRVYSSPSPSPAAALS